MGPLQLGQQIIEGEAACTRVNYSWVNKEMPVCGPEHCHLFVCETGACEPLNARLQQGHDLHIAGGCTTDGDCGHGLCEHHTRRCRCPIDAKAGDFWGGADCSWNNSAVARAHPRYDESKYRIYYEAPNATSTNHSTNDAKHSQSGPGSDLNSTTGVRAVLPRLMTLLGVRTVIDVPCGDFSYMDKVLADPLAPPELDYVGMDIVESLVHSLQQRYGTVIGGRPDSPSARSVTFMRFDLSTQRLWPVDLLIVRDVLFHFSSSRADDVLRNNINRSGAKYLLSTYYPLGSNARSALSFRSGFGFRSFWKINLEDAPFNLPPPLVAIGRDGRASERGRVMGLWRLPFENRRK